MNSIGEILEVALANLQPIRDLSRNWDVDIASCLEDVLKELSIEAADNQINNGTGGRLIVEEGELQSHKVVPNGGLSEGGNGSIGPDHHLASANFAQAALLLQNAGFVYSRKVEYLHALVYRALEEFSSQTKTEGNKLRSKSNGKGGGDPSLDEFDEYDPDVQFLLLDDVLPTVDRGYGDNPPPGRRAIDLDEESIDDIDLTENAGHVMAGRNLDSDLKRNLASSHNGDGRGEVSFASGGSRMSNRKQLENNMTYLSLGGMSVSRYERQAGNGGPSNALRAGGFMGNIFVRGTGAPDGKSQLRLVGNGCDISPSGALLIPGSNMGRPLERDDEDVNILMSTSLQNSQSNFGKEATADFGHCDMQYDDDGDHGFGFQLAEDEAVDHKEPNGKVPDVEEQPILALLNGGTGVKDSQTTSNKETKVEYDPWELLDPHEPGKQKAKPLRVGITYRLPPGVTTDVASSVSGSRFRRRGQQTASVDAAEESRLEEERKQRQRTANGCFISFVPSIRIGDDGNVSFGPSPFMSGEDTPTVSLTGLAYGNEFEYIATATRRRKLAERRAARKKKARENLLEYDEKKDEEFNHENGYGGVDGGDDESNDGGDFQFNAEVDCDADRLGDSAPGGNISADAFEQVFSHVGDGINSGQDPNSEAHTFEELCRAHIKAFAKGAEKYAAETQLSRRVSHWQDRLGPLLEEEERRPEFDIHAYGERILKSVEKEIKVRHSMSKQSTADKSKILKTSKTIDFAVIAQSSEQYDVCRLFLASLMLSNSGNVELSRKGEEEGEEGSISCHDNIQIELINSEFGTPTESCDFLSG